MHRQPSNSKAGQFVRSHLANFPRPDLEAAKAVRQWGKDRGMALDPDDTLVATLHYRADGAKGWIGIVAGQMSLAQAVLGDWQGESANDVFGDLLGGPWAGELPASGITVVDRLAPHSPWLPGADHAVFNGLFRRSSPQRYDASTHLPVSAEAFQSFVWHLDFRQRYKSLLEHYWADGLEHYRLAAKIGFIAACNKQVSEGSLSDVGRRLAWQAAGIAKRGPGYQARAMNIYGYAATDLVLISDSNTGPVLLYIPGNASPLHEFADRRALKAWVGAQCRRVETREALRGHFALADTPDGLDFSGLDTALEGLAIYPAIHRLPPERPGFTTNGAWPPLTYVNYRPGKYNPALRGDLFLALAKRHKQRSLADADFVITSNNDVLKARWRGYLTSAINLLAPLVLVVPELAPLFAAAGTAQFGLGLDQAINGKNANAQAEGVAQASYGLLNAVPLALEGVAKAKVLFRIKSDNFVFPSRVNDQLGYPLSPVSPPHLPDIDVAEFFNDPDAIAPLAGGDPAVAGSIVRVPRYDGQHDLLNASIGGYNAEMVYDLERDAFLFEDDVNAVEPPCYIAQAGQKDLIHIDAATRQVTNTMRERSLRALGIELSLPVELPAPPTGERLPIPKKISSLWVGDQHIDERLLNNLGLNVQCLKDSAYQYRLFLSKATPAAYEENVRALAEAAPGLTVMPLEDQTFFQAFRQSPAFEQYQAALDGNGGVARNYASASDVLRYPMLAQEGGLYVDVDDTFLAATGERAGAAIDTLDLATTQDGLLLPPPMSNEKMRMNCLFNTSLIGSHAGNPTLALIGEEMRVRYLAERDFYESRPSLADDPDGFYRYAGRLSRLTGPALLTDIVDRQWPRLRTLRQVVNLYSMPQVNATQFLDITAVTQTVHDELPLNRVAKVGGFHSWART
ncbi:MULTISPECIES: DUF6543 domain-containing protein [unclassified Pseudomonas]|uniref:dermonecrotic toxin domain-containing protein n=1 Tax=unclassified Pseudomonas TaxID=196821 RepID=UPI00244C5113|nr:MULTISPECIES: DUF6543 domain-containing protein [unclassified Pseudomonas]MDH0300275.1 glycosyltransferase [Pseudomonas sp. GD04091]MDH1987733.1 glycosyltransferase [Pseudomonas sp. GD03689]